MQVEEIEGLIIDLEKAVIDLKKKLNITLLIVEVKKIKLNIQKIQEDIVYLIEIKKNFESIACKYTEIQLNDLVEKIKKDIDNADNIAY